MPPRLPGPYAGRVNALASWWLRWRDTPVRDVATALIMTAVTLIGAYGEAHPSQASDINVHGHHVPYTPDAAFLLVAVAALVLAFWRRYPLTVLAVSTTAVAVYSLLGYVNGAALLSPSLALYGVARTVSVRRAVVAAAATLVVLMGSTAFGNPFGITGGGFDLIPALIAAALFGGIAVSARSAYIASIQARAQDEVSRRVSEERLRIARELHDVVAHTMSTINVQASAAAAVLADRPDVAADSLQAIRTASKNGLRELRAILNVLRQADDSDPASPTPGLAQVGGLIAGAVQAGLPASISVTGEPAPLPAAVDLAAYRIIQESLTNVIRHAGPATASVCLTYRGGDLLIEISDTGRGEAAAQIGAGHAGQGQRAGQDGAGHGLIGMRERAAAAGGTLTAGPASSGGFRVTARLPFAAQDEPEEARS
jgi:signal transduction histidine kinase